jgi:hypothetical protein
VYLIILLLAVAFATVLFLRAQDLRIVQGVVCDEAGPVAGAVVRLRGSSEYVRTDAQGRFRLPVNDTDRQITAWAPGYYIGGEDVAAFFNAEGADFLLHSHPTSDNPDYTFISPVLDMTNETACGHCHRERTGETNGAMPVEEWLQDAHSSAPTNPRFLSLYNGTTIDGITGDLTTYAFDPAQGLNVPVSPSMRQDQVGPGFRLDFPDQAGSCAACHVPVLALKSPYQANPNHAEGVATEGVTCDFCHKIQGVRLGSDGKPSPALPGVLSLDFLRPSEGQQIFMGPFDDTPGEDIYSPLQNQSKFCAPCHSGQFWDVPIYDSFGEWLDSPYSDPETGQTCQDCHMPPAGVTTFVQLPPDRSDIIPPRDPETIFSHKMPGAADQTLLQNTASLEVQTARVGDQLKVTVKVTNTGAGHHIPTDSPLRNMILLVQAVDSTEQPLKLLVGPTIPVWGGEGDPAQGYYAGQPGVLYAKVLADLYTGETPSFAYWRPTRLISDNRIPALATDESSYAFALPLDTEGVTVEARLYLRRAFITLMDLKAWDTPDILMEEQTVRLP